ncbi:hypothetical protein QYE76_049275 [Lolium multiflorum]|uniref:PIR2-like helical domain-containing protein n=1 Tax=Lolium multiflorum TaxID=4521 RepID=A0AAD8SPP5_LOLMU|nr:hypothetical protein QYE76_049275 [Lolium multiflorum]
MHAVKATMAKLKRLGTSIRPDFRAPTAGDALKAEHPMPEDVALLCQPAVQEPSEDMRAVLATLEEGRRLTIADVETILCVLQSHHRKISAQLKLTVPRSHRGSGEILHHSFNGGEGGGGVVAVTCTFQHRAPFNLANLRSPEIIRRKLQSCLASIPKYTPHTPVEVADASPTCEHIELLKAGLLDTIHAFYMKALARLPRAALRHLLRGVLVAGHCYGPMDPVSNIIVHAVWYSVVAPPLRSECRSEPDILGVAALLRLEVRSLDGLIAIVRAATGFGEHRAVEYLCANRCDVADTVLRRAAPETRGGALRLASEAAKHPLEEHHSSFLASLASSDDKDILTSLLRPTEAELLSDESITQLRGILGDRYTSIAPVPTPADLDSLQSKKQSLEKRKSFLRKELQELLHCYADQHPWVIKMHI